MELIVMLSMIATIIIMNLIIITMATRLIILNYNFQMLGILDTKTATTINYDN